jgi:hypothetical protein
VKAQLHTKNGPPPMVVSWLDDVLYPSSMYRKGACHVASELLKLMFGVDVFVPLMEIYRTGHELEAVRAVLERSFAECDPRIMVKVAAAMESHIPNLSPYQDALETFPLLQTFGVPLALVGEGSRIGQRLVAERLRLHGLFQHMVHADPRSGVHGWGNAFLMLEVFSGLSRDNAVVVCGDIRRVRELANEGWLVVYLCRAGASCAEDPVALPRGVFTVVNLYELPEALGLVAWGGEEEFEKQV